VYCAFKYGSHNGPPTDRSLSGSTAYAATYPS
jgi:hypothetical protein